MYLIYNGRKNVLEIFALRKGSSALILGWGEGQTFYGAYRVLVIQCVDVQVMFCGVVCICCGFGVIS